MKELRNKKVLLLFSHCDDEVICGFPILQQKEIDKTVLICSNDSNNPERDWCKNRGLALFDLMHDLDVSFSCLDFNSGFYRSSTRPEPKLSQTLEVIRNEIANIEFDIVFTHNPMGEYGHIDHILIHQLAMTLGKPVLLTDIFIPMNWVPYQEFADGFKRVYRYVAKSSWHVNNDLNFYKRCEDVYHKHSVWTWCKPPVPHCNLYLL